MIAAITMVKDEADIIGITLAHMISQVDAVLVYDNGSTDGTSEILDYYAATAGVRVYEDEDVAYYQSRKMTRLAEIAYKDLQANWVVPFDADEIWFSRAGRIGDLLEADSTSFVLNVPLYNHIVTPDTPVGGLPPWRFRDPGVLPKVACRAHERLVIQQGNHGAQYGEVYMPGEDSLLEIRHFPYRSAEQMIRKARNGAAAYAATDLPEDTGKHWRDYGARSDDEIHAIFNEWYYEEHPEERDFLVLDPVLAQGPALKLPTIP